jgi:hypothetical protein
MILKKTSNDTVIMDIVESPGNKTLKSLGEIKWVLNNCDVPYILHLPEDFDVNADILADLVSKETFKNGSFFCQTYQARV